MASVAIASVGAQRGSGLGVCGLALLLGSVVVQRGSCFEVPGQVLRLGLAGRLCVSRLPDRGVCGPGLCGSWTDNSRPWEY